MHRTQTAREWRVNIICSDSYTHLDVYKSQGMAITKSIVDMMGGQISVESELGKGTTFQVTLHLKLQKGEEQMDFSALRELRTLVVDDDKDVCEDTARMLREIGMESEWVLTGREAVEKTAASHEAHRDYRCV